MSNFDDSDDEFRQRLLAGKKVSGLDVVTHKRDRRTRFTVLGVAIRKGKAKALCLPHSGGGQNVWLDVASLEIVESFA